jgi:hypothetical protein
MKPLRAVPRRPLYVLAAVVAGVFVVLQLVRPERTNPPVDPSMRLDAHVTVPADVGDILDRSCRDCHTNETRWPWYSHVAPPSLLLARDVREGRDELNLSEWGDYDGETAVEQLDEMCTQVREGSMPLLPYTWMHRAARLSPEDVTRLCEWTKRAREEVASRAEADEEESN